MKPARKRAVRRAGIFLHQTLERAVERKLDPSPLIADLVVERLKAQGFAPSAKDRHAIERACRTNRFDRLHLKALKGKGNVRVKLTDADADAISEQMKESVANLSKVMRATLDEVLPSILATIQRTYPVAIRADEKRYRQQEASIARAWRQPLATLALLIELSCRLMRTVDDYWAEHSASQPKLVHVLRRLHIRSIHVSREIKKLMESGYPDAAMARWRTLHEIATVMCILAENGEECAARYLDHGAVQRFKAASRYQKAAAALGHRPESSATMAKLLRAFDRVVARYGKTFKGEYGWAADALKGKHADFATIEEAVGRSQMRPYYRLASDNVHAGIMGAVHKLGTVKTGRLLLEPSPLGLEEPGQNTALTLALVLAQLLRVCPAFDALAIAESALAIADEAVQEFVAVGASLRVTVTERAGGRKRAWNE